MKSSGRVLVVEDDHSWQAQLSRTLGRESLIVHMVSSAEKALDEIQNHVFHLAVIDLALSGFRPESSTEELPGMSLVRQIRALNPRVPVCIVLTAYPTPQRVRTAFKEYGVWDFLDKHDFERDRFLQVIAEGLRHVDQLLHLVRFDESWDKAYQQVLNRSTHLIPQSLGEIMALVCESLQIPKTFLGAFYGDLHYFTVDMGPVFEEVGVPQGFPVLFLGRDALVETDVYNIRYLLSARLERPVRTAILVLFCMDEAFEDARKLVEAKLRQVYAYDVIVMGRKDIASVLLAEHPRRYLRSLVLAQADLVAVSPFVTTGPTPDNMFFGREKELREITEHAADASYAVISGRRMGKTSILRRLHRIRLPDASLQPFYYQCQHLPETEPTRQQFLTAIAHEWLPELADLTPVSFTDILARLPSNKPLVFLIDEVDRLIPADWTAGWPLFSELRALAESGRCQFVFAGERTLREAMKRGNSPLFNFANAMLIGRLDIPAVEELVTRPMKQLEIELVNEADIVQGTWDATSGHPNVVQRLCQRLIVRINERRDRRLTPDDVEAVVAGPAFQRDDFYDVYLEQATVLGRILPLVLAQDGNEPYTLSEVSCLLDKRLNLIGPNGKKPRAAEVDAALRRLTDLRSILDYTPQGYVFAVKAFPQVIGRWGQVTVEDELMILTEKYRDYGDLTEDEIEQMERER